MNSTDKITDLFRTLLNHKKKKLNYVALHECYSNTNCSVQNEVENMIKTSFWSLTYSLFHNLVPVRFIFSI